MKKYIFATAVVALMFGCASVERQAAKEIGPHLDAAKASFVHTGSLSVVVDRPFVAARVVDYREAAAGGGVSIDAKAVPLADLIGPIASRLGYGVQMLQGVDPRQRVSISLNDVDAISAIRQIAFAAGYVAIPSARDRVIRINDEGTITFRIPPQALTPSGPRVSADFSSSPNTSLASASSASSPGQGAGTSSTSTTLTASARSGSNPLDAYLKSMLGDGATVSFLADAGTVSVRGKGVQLKRAQEFIERYVAEATRRVQVDVVIAEVALNKDWEFGIDWNRVVPLSRGGAVDLNLANASSIANQALTIGTTTNSIASVLKTIEKRSNVRVLSSPSLLLNNNTPGQWSKFTSRPYVPSVTTTPVSTTPTTSSVSSSASLAEVPEGTTLTALANIVDANKVWVTLLASSNDVIGQQQFNPSRDVTLTALIQSRTQIPVSVMAEHGKTLIVGGLRNTRDSRSSAGVPIAGEIPLLRELLSKVNDISSSSEVVVFLHATILPVGRVDVVLAESL